MSSVHEKSPLGVVLDALIKDYRIPIGLEESHLDQDHDEFEFDIAAAVSSYTVGSSSRPITVVRQPVYRATKRLITVNVVNGSLESLLDSIVNQMGNYQWRIEDGVVNIYPKSDRNEFITGLLNVRLRAFTTGNNFIHFIGYNLATAPETNSYSRSNYVTLHYVSFGSANRTRVKLQARIDFKDVRVHEVLNRIAAERKGGWILKTCRHLATRDKHKIDIEF